MTRKWVFERTKLKTLLKRFEHMKKLLMNEIHFIFFITYHRLLINKVTFLNFKL